MAEEKYDLPVIKADISIKKCAAGFMVRGNQYASDELRAFSTPEGLIEWLSRELGAGPIVWSLTLGVWMERAGIEEDDLLPVPDASVDPRGHQMAIEGNAIFLLNHFVEEEEKMRHPEPLPEPKPKKEKKVKEEKGARKGGPREDFVEMRGLTFPEKPKEEVKEE